MMRASAAGCLSAQTRKKGVKKWLVAVVLGGLAVIPPIIMGPMTNQHVEFSEVLSGADYGLKVQELLLQTADGVKISAFEVAALVVFISGIHNPSVTAFFGPSKVLEEHGYASVLFDLRAHGQGEGDLVGLGCTEILDTKAVVDYPKEQERYRDRPIVVYGVSLGEAVAINSWGTLPGSPV